jgi:biotin operon repressor
MSKADKKNSAPKMINKSVLVKQWCDGMPSRDIARYHGISRGAVNNMIAKLRQKGVRLPKRRQSIDVAALNKLIPS